MANADARQASGRSSNDREPLHRRQMEFRAYKRRDGLYEIEGHLTDHKPRDYRLPRTERLVAAGSPVHDMGVRIVFDANQVVREISSITNAAPYEACPAAGLALQALIGIPMSRGWRRQISERLTREANCTHLVGLLVPMATAAVQALSAERRGLPEPVAPDGRPMKIGSCLAYAAAGDIVRAEWPKYADWSDA